MRILLIEDDEVEVALVRAALSSIATTEPVSLQHSGTLEAGLVSLRAAPPDVVLLDLALPDARDLQGLERILQEDPNAIVVVRTSRDEDRSAMDAVRRGAQDYLVKGQQIPALLWRSLRHAVERGRLARASLEQAACAEFQRERALIDAEREMLRGLMRPTSGGDADAVLAPGTLLDERFRIERLIGEGASSRVYAAQDRATGEAVCIKHVRASRGLVALEGIAREARLTSTLAHPNVVKLKGFGTLRSEPYLVLELGEGGTLADLVAKGALASEAARAVMLDVLAGLAYIHERDVLHLDLKPANVVLDADGRAKITDFGIALPTSGSGWQRTQTGLGGPGVQGTPAYASPEVVMGLPPTPRSDVYSAGALLYHLLAGRPYLDLEGLTLAQTRAAIRARAPRPGAPEGAVLAVATRALSKDPRKRYPSASAMLEALSPPSVRVPVRDADPKRVDAGASERLQ